MAEAKNQEKRAVQIDPGRMQLAEFARQNWVANAPEGSTIDDCQNPGFWSLMAAQMKPYDRVEVRADDGTWIAEFIVLGCDRNWARVHLLSHHKLTTVDVSQSESQKYEMRWRGPQHKWSIVRLSDQVAVKEGCETKEAAASWMKEHEQAA